jgi:hypothetical protein
MIGKLVLAAAMIGGLSALGGCVSYATYPPVPKDTAINDPNTPAMEEVAAAGLKWVVGKYPPGPEGAAFALNLPEGTTPVVYRRMAAAVGNGAEVLTPENSHLPIYHVVSIRIRGDQANVWIDRPVVALGTTPQGTAVYQEVKLWLQGGLSPWHVVNALERTPGLAEIPALNYYEPEPPPTVRPSKEEDATYKPRPRPQEAPGGNEPAEAPPDEPRNETPKLPPGATPNG